MRVRAFIAGVLATGALLLPATVYAQSANFLYSDTQLQPPLIPDGFDRGRNVSVIEKPRPDYDPLGVPIASFNAYPVLAVSAGATDNVFLTSNNSRSSGFAVIDPAVNVQSDWSRHSLAFNAGADIQRYFSEPTRDQSNWNVGGKGRLDVSDSLTLSAEADGTRQFESPYSGGTTSEAAIFSSLTANYFEGRAEYKAGRVRFQVAVDRTGVSFSKLRVEDGESVDQGYRDEHTTRLTGQAEYALSPTISIYVRANYYWTDYLQPIAPGVPNRDSRGVRLSAGVNVDIASFVRGTLAAGYVKRNYDSGIYKDVTGASVEGKLEFFPSELTTFTLKGQRFLEDSGLFNNNAYFDNRISLRVDHELLTNLLVGFGGEYVKIQYVGLHGSDRDNYRFVATARYMATRRYGLRASVSYGRQTPVSANSALIGQQFSELAGQLGFYLQL